MSRPQRAIATCKMDITTILPTTRIRAITPTGIIHRFTSATATTGQCIFSDQRTSALMDSAAAGEASVIVEKR